LAITLLGENVSEPLAPPTSTMCVGTIPVMPDPDDEDPDDPDDELAVDCIPTAAAVAEARRDPDAEREWVVAAAEPMRTEMMADLEKYILKVVFVLRKAIGWITGIGEFGKNVYRRLALYR
jgi:hypothetical protein